MVRPRPRRRPAEGSDSGEAWKSLALWAVNERIKEFTCLYGISELVTRADLPLPELLDAAVERLPHGWQHPAITAARITLDGADHATAGFVERADRLCADISIGGHVRGSVEVVYLEPQPVCDEGPFLDEERHLIDAVAEQIALAVEQREALRERERLEDQLRHADRLATIGQMAASVVHELNEPLASVLGFAQLARKSGELPETVRHDLDRIVAAALHAREVARKLMLFAKHAPPATIQVDLNQVVELGLYFLELRCAKQGIELVRSLSPGLPVLLADPAQLQQVLVNLVVNAIQSMPEGGRLTIRTARDDDAVVLTVEDTGEGMAAEVKDKVFEPFFTTKSSDQGTGLGLSVVQGIVTAHGGRIRVQSEPGKGSRFVVELPAAAYVGEDGGVPVG